MLSGCGGSDTDAPPSAAPQPAPLPAPPEPLPVSACPAGIETGDIIPSALAAPVCDSTQFDIHSDLAYASHGDALLDLLVPRNANAPAPLVVWIHGGGWQSGDKADRAQSQRLVCRGFALAAINYRLSDTAPFPAQIQDVKAAIRFLRANAATYGLDPERIAVFGSSAGGHLAALAGTSGDVVGFDAPVLGNATISSRVQVVVDWYGPTRLVEMDAQALAQGCPVGSARHSTADSAESRLLGCTLGDAACAAAAQRADPSTYADSTDPPHLLLHGTADCVSPGAQSALLAQALASGGACAVHRRVTGAGHGGAAWTTPEVQDAVAEFLERTLASPSPSP
jgi:acetyl esterase/lipase